jgi:hypothetical protein
MQNAEGRMQKKRPGDGEGRSDETRIAPIGTEGSSPALVRRQSDASCKSVVSVSGSGPVLVR